GPTCLGTSGAGFAGTRRSGPAGRTPVRQPGPAGVLLPAHLPGGPPELAPQVPGDVPDLGPDLRRHAAHRVPDLALQLGQLPAAAGQLVPAGRGDRVDLAAALLAVGDQALGLQPGQPRVDGAGAGRVPAEELVLQQPDELVPVPRAVRQQLQQVQPEPAGAEHVRHTGALPVAARRSERGPDPAFAARAP